MTRAIVVCERCTTRCSQCLDRSAARRVACGFVAFGAVVLSSLLSMLRALSVSKASQTSPSSSCKQDDVVSSERALFFLVHLAAVRAAAAAHNVAASARKVTLPLLLVCARRPSSTCTRPGRAHAAREHAYCGRCCPSRTLREHESECGRSIVCDTRMQRSENGSCCCANATQVPRARANCYANGRPSLIIGTVHCTACMHARAAAGRLRLRAFVGR